MITKLEAIRREAREAHAQHQHLIAEQLYRTLLSENPHVDDAVNLGAILRSQGRLQEGSSFYKQWVGHFRSEENLLLNACNCWNDNNEANLVLEHLEPLLGNKKLSQNLKLCLADALHRLNRCQDCITLLRQCLHDECSNKEAWLRLGLAYTKNNEYHLALEAFEKALELNPGNTAIIGNQITILKDLGRFKEAEEILSELSNEKQLHVDIAQATAGLWMAQNKLVEATGLFQHICKHKPNVAGYWLNWAAALRGLRHTVAPYRVLQRGLCHEPHNADLQEALKQILAEMARIDAAERCHFLWPPNNKKLKTTHLFSHQFLGIGTSATNSQKLANQARDWEKRCQKQLPGPLWLDSIQLPINGRRLRIGYLSADLANHPVGRFLLPVLSHHDREQIEVWALNCGSHEDWITSHIRERVDHWIDLRFKTTTQCARIVADLQLDVIVELGGFTGDSMVELLCHRPAPVQLSYLGYPGPTYLRCIDGWLGDEVLFEQLNEVDREAHPLIKLKGGYMVFDPGGELPAPNRTAGQRFRFGSFNHARKLTESTINLFCRVMEANPEAELVLKSISFCEAAEQQRIRQRFEKAGLSSRRLILLDWVEGGINHLKLYSEIDVALDPIPYGGATTTAEALWMGVPVVSLAGDGMVGRLAASLLIYGKQSNWVAQSLDRYIAIASTLARQGPRGKDQRVILRKAMQRSPLADGPRLSKELEKHFLALRQAIKPYEASRDAFC